MDLRIKSLEGYKAKYSASIKDPEQFWDEVAKTFQWKSPYDKVLEWEFDTPDVKWFLGGKMNITENCLDRHLAERGDQTAILWEPNDPNGEAKHITYRQLYEEVNKVANGLRSNGVGKGDRVVFYMPMVPELAISVLACARIGAI
ncbi:MAG: AMP-binding protein, partial [Flavobacteriales bacterium]|nr:AMP-binding protein [Flavobacteriales bacterium]